MFVLITGCYPQGLAGRPQQHLRRRRDRTSGAHPHPAQAAAEGATRERLARIGGSDALIIDWLDAAPLDAVPLGPLASDPQTLTTWRERNRHALREFWARAPADALGEWAVMRVSDGSVVRQGFDNAGGARVCIDRRSATGGIGSPMGITLPDFTSIKVPTPDPTLPGERGIST